MPLGHRALYNLLRSRIAQLRSERGLTQEQVAKAADITLQYYQGLEGGRRKNPSLKVLAGLSKAFGVEVWQLLAPNQERTG